MARCGQCCRRVRSSLPNKRMTKIYITVFLNLASLLQCFNVLLLPISCVQFSSAFGLTMLFPYLPFMVEFLMPELEGDQQAIGKLPHSSVEQLVNLVPFPLLQAIMLESLEGPSSWAGSLEG